MCVESLGIWRLRTLVGQIAAEVEDCGTGEGGEASAMRRNIRTVLPSSSYVLDLWM